MLSAGLESLLDSPVVAVLEELHPGLPRSVSTELMAVPGPALGLGPQPEGSGPVLTHRDTAWTSAGGDFCQETKDLGDVLEVVARGPAESLPEELLQAGDLEEDEENKIGHFRKLNCCSGGLQKEDGEAQGAEDCPAEGSAFTPGETWSKQEEPPLDQPEAKSSEARCTEAAGSVGSTEENQANVQVTAETLPKLTEEVQGMKADGTRIFSKAGFRNDRVSKALPAESNECPDVDTVMARAGVAQTSILDFLEPLKVTDIEAVTDHPQETNDSDGSDAHIAMPLGTGASGVSVLDIREEKLPRQNPAAEFSTSLANYQTCQQDEDKDAHDPCNGAVPKQSAPPGLSSAGTCRTLATPSPAVLYPVVKSICCLDFRNMPLENTSTAVHGVINETPLKYLPQNMECHTRCRHGTGFVGNGASTSIPAEQIPVSRSEGLSRAKTDPREFSASTGKSFRPEFEEAAEVWRKIAVGDNREVWSQPEAQQGVNCQHCHSSVFSSVVSSPEEFSEDKLKIVPSEGDKLKKDQWQFSVSDPCKDGIKENSLLMETSSIASHGTGQRDKGTYNTSKKIPPPSNHSFLDLSTKLEKHPPKAQLLEKESESNKTSEGLPDSRDSLSTGKETHLFHTLHVNLPPVLQKSREPHHDECPPCTANEISHRDKAWDNLSGKETIGASGTTRQQVAEVLLRKEKFKSSVSSRTFDNPNMTSRVSQKNMKSAGNLERVVPGLENEHCYTQHCDNRGIKWQCTAASASCLLSASTRVHEVFLNSLFDVDLDKRMEENDNLEGEPSAGCNSQEAIIFPEAHFPLACGSLPCGGDWSNRGVAPHGTNDILAGKTMFCSAYTAEKSAATLGRGEISKENVEVVKELDLCEVADGSEIVHDRDEAKEEMGPCASQTQESDGMRTTESPNTPEGRQRDGSREQLIGRYLNKNTCAHNFGFCNAVLGPRQGLGTQEGKGGPSLPADPSECSTSVCGLCPAPANGSVPTRHSSHTESTLCLGQGRCRGCQRDLDGPEQCSGTLTTQPNPGLPTTDSSEEESESGSSLGEEIVLKAGDDPALLMHKYAREDKFGGTLKETAVNLDSLIGVRNEDSSGYMGSISGVMEKKTIKLKDHEGECERDNEGTLEGFSDSKPHGSLLCIIKCAPEKAELVSAESKTHPSLPKMKWLVEDQKNTVSTQFLPISSHHGSLSYNPENMSQLSDMENRESQSIKSILNNTSPQLTSEPTEETDAQRSVGPSSSGKFDIQEPFNETQVDSETLSALDCGISLPEKEQLCVSPDNTQRDNLSSAEVFSRDSSMTKILSVTISVKRKCSNIEIPSSESEMATGSLSGAKSSRVCAHSKESLKGEGLCTPTVKAMDGTSPESPPWEEKFKITHRPENVNVLSDAKNREILSIKPLLNNTCPQLTSEPGNETSAPRGVGPSHPGKFDIQEPFNETQVDSETLSALNCGISLPEKEQLCVSPDNTQRDNLSSAEVFSRDSSMTKILSVTISVKRKCSNIEIPSSESEMATGSVNGAKSSGICALSKESLKGEGLCTPTVKAVDGTSPESPPWEEKFKNTGVEKKMGEDVAPRKRLLRNHLWTSLEDSKESGSKVVPLSAEDHGKVLKEIPRSNLNSLSKERKTDVKLATLAGSSVLSAAVQDCQAAAVSDTGAPPELQWDPTPTACPPLSSPSSPDRGACSEAPVPYKLPARSEGEGTEGQDTGPAQALCKENEALGSKRLDQIKERHITKRKKYGKMAVHQMEQAHQGQRLEQQEKAKIAPSTLHSSELLCSSLNELETPRNVKFEGPPEEIFAVRSSESKLYSTLQEVKRPKITTYVISSQFLKTQDSDMENLNLNLGYDGIPGAFETTNKLRGPTKKVRGPLPLKIQPGRTCKKVPTLYQLKTIRKIKKHKSPPFFELPLEIFPKQENTPLESLYFPCKPPTGERETAMRFAPLPGQRARRGSLLNRLKFRRCTKEPALLSELSAVASKLLAPAKGACSSAPRPDPSEMLPVGDRHSHRRSKNLLEAFSCINRSVRSRWAGSWCTKMFSFQPLALYPVGTTKMLFSDLSHKPPTSFSDTLVFPISFHINLDSSPVTDLTEITSHHSVHHRPVFGETPAPASKWTLSFHLSQSCSDTTAFKADSSLNNELHSSHSITTSRTVALHPDHGRNVVAERREGCSTLGLHTVLALSSPGCYRIWTRRRNLSSHIPTIQRLFMSQLAQGLKGGRYPGCVSADLVSSLPYSLGRVLSIWSQHGPSARPSEITPLHPSHCKWQPGVGIENSYAMLPHLPAQSMEALQTAGHEIRLEASFPLPLPKPPSPPESLPCPPRLSVAQLQVHSLDEADASLPACLRSQDDTELKKAEPEKRPKKVSEIRIRKTVPKPDTNLTPMGLPKPKRLKKKEFSLEEIYTNKNYKSPPPARSLETIFEEPKEKNGHLVSVSQQKRKRILEFQDFTLPRKRKSRGKLKAVGSCTRAKRAALQSAELDVLLSQKLMDLEAFLAEEVEQEQACGV